MRLFNIVEVINAILAMDENCIVPNFLQSSNNSSEVFINFL